MKKQIGLSAIVGLLAFCSSSYAQNPPVIPVTAESQGMTRIVPDTIVWFSSSHVIPKLGGFVSGDDVGMGGSVEAGARLMGDSTFLLAASLKATNDPTGTLISRNLVLIPAAGGTPKLDSELYDDSGQIYLRDTSTVRQDGNPGRVGGDMRCGAVNYMAAAETTLFNFPDPLFNSDGRFSHTFWTTIVGDGGARTDTAENFRLNPLTLAVTPLNKAQDVIFYPEQKDASPPLGTQLGRTGSSPIGLANGNFMVVGEDRSKLVNPSGNAAIAKIYAPDGTIVKGDWEVGPVGTDGSMWDSVGAWRGGFFVKPNAGIAYFYDNDGNLQGSIDVNATAGVWFDQGRSDGTRYCSDIRSHYMFAAGKSPEANPGFTNIMLCAWDCKTMLWITNTIVSEGNQDPTDLGGTRFMDRCNLACDAYDRVTVAWRCKPDNGAWGQDQIAARVFAFDGTKFTPLTKQFWAFAEHDSDPNNLAGFKGVEPSVAMTPREILIYAKGMWNTNASPTNPPVTADNTHCYTILSHPAPIAKVRPQMTIAYGSPNSTVSWLADAGLFVLQSTSTPGVPASWADVSPQPAITRTAYVDPTDKYQMSVPNGTSPKFYRLVRHW
jgi:hypothetical protein